MSRLGLPDGGELEWSGDTVPVGDHGLPERLTYTHPGGEKQPACRIEIEVWDGAPVCTGAELIGRPEERIAVLPKDIGALSTMIDYVIEEAGLRLGARRNDARGWGLANPPSVEEERARLRSVRAARRAGNDVELQRVAEIYKNALPPKLTAVADAFGWSERTAARRKKKAVEKGFLDE
jgi:hypothetical protein